MIAMMIFSIRRGVLLDGTGGNANRLVRGHHRHAAALQMRGNHTGQPIDCHIERHEGPVENPQRMPVDHQTRQRHTPFLALRKIAAGEVLTTGKPHLLQRIQRVIFRKYVLGKPGSGQRFSRGVNSSP